LVQITPLSSPLQLDGGQVGTVQSQINYSSPSSSFSSCNVNQLRLNIPLAPGVTILAVRSNGVSIPVVLNGTGDTARALMPNTAIQLVEFDLTVTPGVTPSTYNLNYFYGYTCNATCPIRILGCAGVTILVPVPAPCPAGGGITTASNIERTTAGFTNNTGTARVNLSAVSPVNRKRALPCDSVLVTATGSFVAGDSIVGGENFYYRIAYSLFGGTDRLFNWAGGTYTINGLTSTLPAPAFEGDVSGAHIAIFSLGNGYPAGTVANINLIGTARGPAALTNTLQQVAGLGNNFFVLKAGNSNPNPVTGEPAFSCNGQLLEFYIREPNASFNRQFSPILTGCGNAQLSTGDRYLYLRGNENGSDISGTLPTPAVDYYPGEVRPLVKLDSVSITFGTGLAYVPGTFGGSPNEFMIVSGNANEGGFGGTGSTSINVGTPIVRGNRITWINNGSWLLSDDAQGGGFIMVANFRQLCNAPTSAGITYNYYGKQNPHGATGCPAAFNRTIATNWGLAKPDFVVTNLSGTQVGDQAQECFDIRVVVSTTTGTNTYIAIPGGGGVITAQSLVNTATSASVPIQTYAGGQYMVLGDLPVGTYTYRLCATYASCSNISVPYIVSWSCTGIPANPGVPDCSFITGNLQIQPVPAGIQSQLFVQPANPIQLCDTLKYTVKYTSTLAADVVGGTYTINVPNGMNIAKARIRYPSNATTTQEITPSTTTGVVAIPLSSHTSLVNGLPGVNNAAGTPQREAILELDFLTNCNFTSGQSFTMTATGNLPCGTPAQGNGTLNQTNTTDVAGASQDYFSVFGTLGVGADSIITCEGQTVNASVTVFDNPSIAGGAVLLPTTDSLTVTLPPGIRYIPGSYNCVGPNCFLAPLVNGNVLSFPVPPAGINIPVGGNLNIPFSFGIDALGVQGCGLPGKITLRTVHIISGITCASAPSGVCPNGIGFTTGETDTTIVANKAVINGFGISNLYSYSSLDRYTYDGTFSIGNVPLPVGQNLLVEVFCKSGGVVGATPLGTYTISGAQPINTPINFSSFFAGVCNTDSLVFKISPTTSGGQNQCACGVTQVILYAPYAVDTRDTTICNGNTANLIALTTNRNGGTTTYHATRANAEAGVSAITPSVNPTVTTKYFVRNQFNPTVYAVDSITITVNATPDLTARDTAICLNNSVNLTTMFTANAVAGTVAYYPDYVSAVAQVSPLVSTTVTPGVTSKYFIRKQSALGCFDIDSVQVTVNPLPLAVTRDTAICPGNPVNLSTLIVPNGVTATLTFHTTLANANAGTSPLGSSTVTPMAAITYYTRRVTPQGCVVVDSIKILNQKPFAGADQVGVCLGSGATLTGTSPNTGLWSAQAGNPVGGTLSGTTAGVATVSFSPLATGAYNYIYTSNNCTDTVTLNVTGGFDFNDLPAPWPIVRTGVISCVNGSGVPTGANGAVWAGTGVSNEGIGYGGVALDPYDDGVTGPAFVYGGVTSNFTVTMNSNVSGKTVYYGLWFDWNDNGNFADDLDFAGNPAFYSGSGVTASPVLSTFPVTPPASFTGSYKTRLIVADVPVTSTGFVGNYTNGEVEDYVTLSILPVRLTSFTATASNCNILLNWATAAEDNLKQYEVQQSTDGVNYTTVSTLQGTGSNSKYNFTNSINEGQYFYRLKIVDKDGKLTYSNVATVNAVCTDKSIVVYPNPAKDVLNINISGYKGKIQASLYDGKGQLISISQFVNGKNSISVSALAAGLYTLSIRDEVGNTSNKKINVAH
jgi:hypothetical protein